MFFIFILFITAIFAETQSCITHPDTTDLDITVEEHQLKRDTLAFNSQDKISYWWRYEIYFHKPDINCSISGSHLKVYIHDARGGLAIDGQLFIHNYTELPPVEPEPLTIDDIFDFPNFPWEIVEEEEEVSQELPRCEPYYYQAGDHRASPGTLYEYGYHEFCNIDVTFESKDCIVPALTTINPSTGEKVYVK